MKALYFDCFAGISGDMTLGALLDLGIDKEVFISELKKLNVDGFEIKFDRVSKNGIGALDVEVVLEQGQHIHDEHNYVHKEHNHEHRKHSHIHESHDHNHSHENHGHGHTNQLDHSHVHRNLTDVYKIIEESGITEKAKKLAKAIFMRVAVAEAKVHSKPLEEVHFHEVGAIDSIVDIVGTAICIDILNIDKIYSSVVNDGYGFTTCQHGMIPVPVPATAEIFSNSNVISKQIDIEMELVTPTGAAIIAELPESYGKMPQMHILKIGCGAGKKSSKIPNMLRVYLGEMIENNFDTIIVLESNIDDCSSEILGYTMEKLLDNGAKDVFFTPIQMKKNRPAQMLTVLCDDTDVECMERIIFTETTTIGIRKSRQTRTCLKRESSTVSTKYGVLELKSVEYGECKRQYPEYESARKLAIENGVPLKEIINQLK